MTRIARYGLAKHAHPGSRCRRRASGATGEYALDRGLRANRRNGASDAGQALGLFGWPRGRSGGADASGATWARRQTGRYAPNTTAACPKAMAPSCGATRRQRRSEASSAAGAMANRETIWRGFDQIPAAAETLRALRPIAPRQSSHIRGDRSEQENAPC